jgi:hypothetical protein
VTRADIRREAKLRASLALDIVLRLTTDRRLLRKIARLLLRLGAGPLEYGHSNESCDCPCGMSRPAKAAGFTALRMIAHEPA